MSSFWANLVAAIRSEAQKAVAAAEAEAAKLWAQLKPAVQATEQEIASAAMAAVWAQVPGVLSGTVKFQNAAAQVLTNLGSEGKTAASNLIGAAVQIAFNELQALRPVAPVS